MMSWSVIEEDDHVWVMLVVYLTSKGKSKHTCTAGLGSEDTWWLGGGNEDKTHGPLLRMKESGRSQAVLFALKVMQIRRLFCMKVSEKKSEKYDSLLI